VGVSRPFLPPPPPPPPHTNPSYSYNLDTDQRTSVYPEGSYPHLYHHHQYMRPPEGQAPYHPPPSNYLNYHYPHPYAHHNYFGSPHPESNGRSTSLSTRTDKKKVEHTNSGIETLERNIRKSPVVLIVESFSDCAGRCRSVQMILSNLGVSEQDILVYSLDSRSDGAILSRHVTKMTGYDNVPVLFVGGQCLGDYVAILSMQRLDQLRPKLMDAGVKSVVNAIPSATLATNIFGYPKALVEGQLSVREGNTESVMNVLVACCGSSAADKVPTLIEQCVANNWSVKLLCTKSGEHFFKSFGSDRVIAAIGAENIYRDEDEWSFEYEGK
jgi:Flavoprotein